MSPCLKLITEASLLLLGQRSEPWCPLTGSGPCPPLQAHLLCAPVKEEAAGVQRPQGALTKGKGRTGAGQKGSCKLDPLILMSEPGRLRLDGVKHLALSCARERGWVKL